MERLGTTFLREVDIEVLETAYGFEQAFSLVQEHYGELCGLLAKHVLRGRPDRVLMHVGRPDARVTRSFLTEGVKPLLLVDDEGRRTHDLGAGERLTLRAIPCPPGMEPDRTLGRALC